VPFLTRSDLRINYSRTGEGPAVLFIQGVGLPGGAWQPQIDGLSDRYDVVTFDNRGVGLSQDNLDPLTIEALAADALAIMDAEDIEQFHVVGHSMGGLIAQQVALTAPDWVQSLSLMCTFGFGKEATHPTAGMILTALRMRIGTRPMRRKAFVELIMPPSYLHSVDEAELMAKLQHLFGRDLAEQPGIVMRQLRAMGRFDPRSRVAALATIPTLVVSAAHDRIALPAYGQKLAHSIPGARYVEIAEAGHAVPIQCADKINALLTEQFAEGEIRNPKRERPTDAEGGDGDGDADANKSDGRLLADQRSGKFDK
jgi:aminoacrylate hydrolase